MYSPLAAAARALLSSSSFSARAAPAPRRLLASSSSSTSSSSSSSSPPPPRRAPMPWVSRSRFPEKRGLVHGAPFRQVARALPEAAAARRAVPPALGIAPPPYALRGGSVPASYPEPALHASPAARDRMRRASAVAAEVLARAGELVRAGVTTDALDAAVHELSLARGAYPSPLGYMGFPKSVCASVNEVVCHGIPHAGAALERGDLVKLDVSCFVGGVHGDTCRTFVVGGDGDATDGSDCAAELGGGGGGREGGGGVAAAAGAGLGGGGLGGGLGGFGALGAADAASRRLVLLTKRALDAAIAVCGPGVPVGAVGGCIEALLERERLEGVAAFAGHGIGEVFHTEPIVFHHANQSRYVMREGMTFTIEPMVVEGSNAVELWPDGWAVVTKDGGRAAQFEHTLLVTAHGVEVLTRWE